MTVLQALAAFLFGYLFGSIPFGLILTRLAGTADIRAIGSGNIGATNVLRTGHRGLAAATLVGDALKGTAAVLIVRKVAGLDPAMVAALGAFLGHVFPVWLKFRGGKGVATFIGLLLGLYWPAAIAFCVVWLAVAAVSRYSSLGGLSGSVVAPAFLWINGQHRLALLFVVLAVLLWFTHRANIARLLAGTESKIGQRSAAAKEPVGERT